MRAHVEVDATQELGPLELWRHGIGLGGINSLPLPDRVVDGARQLQPRVIRIFIQEFFRIYPESGRFDWTRLDPYMEALARTGARVMAAIAIKPSPLYPRVDQALWRPSDSSEWQHLIRELVRRYSVERPLVTHWEVGNEPDIGEDGGSPYLIRDGGDYAEYYAMTVEAVLQAFPGARVGGPAMAGLLNPPLPGFLRACRERGLQLDFLSWHLYHSDPGRHAYLAQVARVLAADLPHSPELMVTEWSTGFNPDFTEDRAFDPRRAAVVARSVIDMRRAGVDGSFYYHLWDQVCFPSDFEPFFSPPGVTNMLRHWNETPHRFGLFAVDGQARAQYFVFQLLSRLGEVELPATSDRPDVGVLAGRSGESIAILLVNQGLEEAQPGVVDVRFNGVRSGQHTVSAYRIDGDRRWDDAELTLAPVERRTSWVEGEYLCRCELPANSVAMVCLEPADMSDIGS
ncbi:hypothetical protein ACFL6X_01480 [Candidatus Latescibacterota bacterium]